MSRDTSFLPSDPEFVGLIPLRSELTVLPADKPSSKTIGWTVKETVGVGIVNAKAVTRLGLERAEPVFTCPVPDYGKRILHVLPERNEKLGYRLKVLLKSPDWDVSTLAYDGRTFQDDDGGHMTNGDDPECLCGAVLRHCCDEPDWSEAYAALKKLPLWAEFLAEVRRAWEVSSVILA